MVHVSVCFYDKQDSLELFFESRRFRDQSFDNDDFCFNFYVEMIFWNPKTQHCNFAANTLTFLSF